MSLDSALGLLSLVLAGAGAAVGLLLGLFFLRSRSGDRTTNRYLAAFLGLAAVVQVHAILFPALAQDAAHRRLPDPIFFLVGPVVWFSFRALGDDPSSRWRHGPFDALHALPFVGAFLVAASSSWSGTAVVVALWALLAVSLGAYLHASRRLSLRREAELKKSYSSEREVSLARLRGALLVASVVFFAAPVAIVFFLHGASGDVVRRLLDSLLAALVFVFGYRALRLAERARVSMRVSEPGAEKGDAREAAASATPDDGRKYRRSGMTPAEAKSHFDGLRRFMEKERTFQEPELSLASLSERTGYAVYELSQILNEGGAASFYEFVNGFRIREVLDRLDDPNAPAAPVLDVALASGFNSKATFNRVFRKAIGMTPAEYRKSKSHPAG
jgi:AraC-like DNA-binding protein